MTSWKLVGRGGDELPLPVTAKGRVREGWEGTSKVGKGNDEEGPDRTVVTSGDGWLW